jgi:predicted PurR-regulated permease PerM
MALLMASARANEPPLDDDEPSRSVLELHVPLATIVKVLVTAVVVWAALRLLPDFFFFLLALLFAVTLSPLVARMEARGISRGWAVALVALAFVITVAGLVIVVGPPLVSQMVTLVERLPEFTARVHAHIPAQHGLLRNLVTEVLAFPSSARVTAALHPIEWGATAIVAATVAVLVVSLTLYLLADGKRTYAWILAYVPRKHRKKMAQTIPEVSEVVIAYVQGQALTSFLYGLFTLAVLSIFHVPAAVPLAVLSAICDVIPVIGLLASTIPAVLLALTVSPLTALAVLLLYLAYHLVENYVLIPRVYGRQLRLSTLAVMIALVVGGHLYGILGAILVLPLVAAYPIVERIWLHEYLSDEVIHDHTALAAAAETGSDRAVDKVLRGDEHPVRGTTAERAMPELGRESS